MLSAFKRTTIAFLYLLLAALTSTHFQQNCSAQSQVKSLTANDLIDLHRTTIESIASGEIVVRTVVTTDIAATDKQKKHVKAMGKSYAWIFQNEDERVVKSQVTGRKLGEFSGLEMLLGNREYSNGTGGYRSIQHFDGQLVKGELPVDSPASGNVGMKRKT